ncbi:MAG: Fic family protein [Phycisphaerae bacterium]|nr:Fic family protein [Phycisphaerae bacterium]
MVEIMRDSDFQDRTTGELVRTVFVERTQDGSSRTINGLAFVPRPLPPGLDPVTLTGKLYDVLDAAKTSLLRLEAKVESLPSKTALLASMRAREAQSSSKIENTVATLRDIAMAAAEAERAPSEAVEVLRNRRAIEAGLRSKLPVSIRLVCEMHAVLIDAPGKRPGTLRDIQAYIGDEERGFGRARFVPPPPDRIGECMKQWELFVNPGALNAPRRPRLPDLVELAFAHYQFEAIHPFSDGNGRLGRALVNVTPVKNGLLRQPVCNISDWVHERRQEYYDGLLRVSTHGDWEGWARFFCLALKEQAEQDLRRADHVAGLHERYMLLVTRRRNSIMLTKLIDRLFENPAVTVTGAASVMGVSYTAAKRHIDYLLARRVLRPADAREYAKVFIAPEIIRAIRGPGED